MIRPAPHGAGIAFRGLGRARRTSRQVVWRWGRAGDDLTASRRYARDGGMRIHHLAPPRCR
ncbi:uncharacterized protein AruCF_3389 [Achromobacter ruhlandii]|nr:uncharacterized protein AruCF_3389 [Achromobacter ruhlandii]